MDETGTSLEDGSCATESEKQLDGPNVELDASVNVEASADASVNVEASADASVNVEASADASVELNASVNVEASADADVIRDASPVDDVNNISRSYIISEYGHCHGDENVVKHAGDVSNSFVSKSYVVSDNNETTVMDETENPFLSNIEKSHDIESVVTNGKVQPDEALDQGSYRQSTNMAQDSLDVYATQSFDDFDVAKDNNLEVIEDNTCSKKNTHEDGPSTLGNIIERNETTNEDIYTDDPSCSGIMESNESKQDAYEDDPPSLRSIKSIAERKKKKLLEDRTEKSVKPDVQKVLENQAEKSVKPDAKSVKLDAKNRSRYGRSNVITENSVSKVNPRKEERSFVSRSQVKNAVPAKKTFNTSNTKYSSKVTNANARNPTRQLGRGDQSQKEFQQLQILNEKERKNSLKIYQNLKCSQSKWKTEKEKLCFDYEKKIQELNKKINSLGKNNYELEGSESILPPMNEEVVRNLQNQLGQQDLMIKGFQTENERLYNTIKDQEITIKKMESQSEDEKKELVEAMDSLKMTHQLENEKLDKKLKWYAENQLLLDKDANELKESREKIKELRVLLERSEGEARQLRNENTDLKRGLYNESSKTVKETVGQSNQTPCEKPESDRIFVEKLESSTNKEKEDSTVNVYLEKRVKLLESELEEKDSENSRKIRAIEQKYGILTSEYEDQTKQLEKRISELITKNASERSSAELESRIKMLESNHSIEIGELKGIIDMKNDEILTLKADLNNNLKPDSEKAFKPIHVLRKQVETLKKKLKVKELQVSELNSDIMLLQKDRKVLTEELQTSAKTKQLEQSPGRTFQKSLLRDSIELKRKDKKNVEEKYLSCRAENEVLKRLIEEIQIEREESRLRYEAIEAKSQNEIRTLTERFEEEKDENEEKHRKVIEELKTEYAVEYSSSKMAELNGKVAGYELMIQHLKNTLEEAKIDRSRLNQMKVDKELLEQKISQLQREAIEAQNFDTPEISDYKKLVAKIKVMENNHYSREEKLQTIIDNTKSKAVLDIKEVEDKWRQELQKKNIEVGKFQEELNGIIEVLHELQKQGVVIKPGNNANLPS